MEGCADGTVHVGGLNAKPGRGFELESDSAVSSPVTRQKAAAAKQFIENHYKNYLQGLQERMERFVASIFHELYRIRTRLTFA